MNIFDILILQPIFNVLMLIYGLIPGGDFGVSVILLTIIIRFLMWPLIKKQLHQTKLMREMQPELKRIKVKAKGNKQLEAQMMMELYREKGISPFGSIGILIVQLPIFIALYQTINIVTRSRDLIGKYTYDPIESIPAIRDLVANPDGFNETFAGFINLTKAALGQPEIYWPILILAVAAAGLQFVQSKQITPQSDGKKKLRDLMKEQANGKNVDQSEINAIVSSRMIMFLPIMTLLISLYLPGALVLYLATQSAVAILQQWYILNRDTKEMEDIADKPSKTPSPSQKTKKAQPKKVAEAIEAEIVPPKNPTKKPAAKKRHKKRR